MRNSCSTSPQPLSQMIDEFEQMLGEGMTIYQPELLAEAKVA